MTRSKSSPASSPHALRRRGAMKRCSASALLVSRGVDVRYLSGFTGDDSMLLVTASRACLITDGRYDEQAHRECPDIDICVRSGAMAAAVATVAKDFAPPSLGIQADHMTVRSRRELVKRLGRNVRDVSAVVSALRAAKDDREILAVRKAVRTAQRAFRDILAGGAKAFVGRTERDVAARLDYLMRLAGASEAAFETIVAAGAHSSLPHHRPGATVIRGDQAVLIDWGAKVDGYCSDLTRVVFTGRIPPEIAAIYKVVLRAQRAAIAAVRPGVSCAGVDAAGRNVIEAAGYGEQFVHSIGHGIGLEIHEAPSVARAVKTRLRRGMIVTVEPGIYLPGLGGVRIEDDILVTAQGGRRLSSLPRSTAAMTVR